MGDNPRVIFVLPSLGTGGAERVVVTLANAICEEYNVTIVSLFKTDSVYSFDNRIFRENLANKNITSTNVFSALYNNILLVLKLKRIVKKSNANLLIGFTTTANIIAIIVSKLAGIQCIISERANPYLFNPNKLWTITRKNLYRYASCLIVQSDHSKSYFSRLINQEKIRILPNPLSKDIENNRDLTIPKSNIVLSVGRLDTNKNQKMLITAFAQINAPNWELVLVGDGQRRKELEHLVEQLEITEKVVFTGNIRHTSDYYNKAKIFAFTSRSEGFPNVLIEAMYHGLAIVSTNCDSGPAELIQDGINGYLIPVDDVEALKTKLEELMRDEALRNKLGESAKSKSKNFTLDNVVVDWKELINNNLQ